MRNAIWVTKTGIAQLKILIRDKVAEMVQKSIDKAKGLSTEENNPKKIKELEEENKKLKEQLEILRGKLYERI